MIYDYIYFYASKYLPWPFSLLASLVAMLVALLLIIAVVPVFIGWVDRKFSARVESRWGPVYVGPFGLLQNVADVIKLMGKRFITSKGDWFSYNFAPLALGVASFLMVAIIPWGLPSLAFINIPYNLLFVYIFLAVSPLLILTAGWGENNKYAIIGGFRGAAQIATYELALLITIVSAAVVSGTYSIAGIVNGQSHVWYIGYLPLTFLIFIVAGLGVIEREPFDMPEASQELQAGWKVEYSGIKFGFFLLSDYIRLLVLSMLLVYIFLGGWLGPAMIPPFAWFWIKTTLALFMLMIPRWVYGRPRIDQFIRFGWNWLLPLAIINLLAAGVLVFI